MTVHQSNVFPLKTLARSVQYVAPSASSACSAVSAEDVRAAQRAQPAQSVQRMCEPRAQRAQRGGCASRAAQRAQRAARRMCEPRSGSPVKERSRLRECDAHPEGIITRCSASRPIVILYEYIWGRGHPVTSEFCPILLIEDSLGGRINLQKEIA